MDLNPDDYESPLMVIGSYQKAGDEANLRRYAEIGIQRARRHLEDYPDNPRPWYLGAAAFLVLKQPDEARRWAEAALAIAPEDRSTRYNVACFFALTGEAEEALDLLENSIVVRSWIENDPELDSLRNHPRYHALIASL